MIDLLERERNELPSERHHTRNANVRENLRRRMETARQLLVQLRQPANA